MSKYIDAERLKTYVQARRDIHYNHYVKTGVGCIAEYKYDEDVDLLDLINSLQQEQPEVDLENEIQEYIQKLGFGYGGWVDGLSDEDLKQIARHFYELARQKQ